ncbi:LuxR family transcriptional regulator [Actinomadura sp. KC06]|uniref:ATP-binding protein n=1 Tax=Actinomadura sp. KC06 TaxID=2530369 RepID=UPI0010462852|nr:LuxR family transcriptional regulator [Actinomadura sp. KC06]TDD28700.1 LuxR family transcriptional regulator [Actinomadura sp. KC06]
MTENGGRVNGRGRSGRSTVSVRTGSPVLIGRAAELDTLATAIAGFPSVAFVEGEAGVGKTRLVAELVNGLRAGEDRDGDEGDDAWIAVGYCQPLSDPFPYGVIFECLRACGDRIAEPSAVTGALRPYLPELADRLPPPPDPLGDPAAERHRLFRAVRDLLAALGRAVLVIEDVHWADDGTRQLLRFVMSNPPPGLSLVVTFRREDLPADAPLGRAFRPPPGTTAAHLVLGPLDTEAVRGLVGAILGGRTVPAGFAEILRQRTAGIPFVVEEMTYSLRDLDGGVRFDGAAARRLLDNVEVPALLREAMAERMHALPAAARSLAEAAAVLGVPATAALLSEVAGAGDHEQVTRLLDGAVLVETAENEYGYRHALAQRAVYDALPGPYRQDLHLRALRALARRDPPPLVRLAAHAKHAGLLADWLRHSEDAADASVVAGDASTAIDLLCATVADPSVPAADVNRLATKLCQHALTGLHHDGVITQIERLLSDARLSDMVRGEVRLWLGLLLVRRTGEMDRGRAHIELAIGSLRDHPARWLRGMAVLALPYLGTTPIAESHAWLDEVDEALAELPPGALRTSLLANTVGARLIAGEPRARDRIALLPAPSEPGDTEQTRELARSHCNLADACSWIGDYPHAWEHLHIGLTLATQAGAPYVIGTAEATRIRLDWLAGAWDGLEERAERMAQTYTYLLPVASELQLVLGWLATVRGDWDRAEACYQATRMSQPDSAIIPVANAATGGMVTMLLDRGDVAAACAHADRGAALLRRKGLWVWAGDLAPQAVEAFLAGGRDDDARTLVADLRAGLAGLHAPLAAAALDACRAQLARAAGDPAAARLFASAIRRHERLGLPYRTARLTERAARGEPADAEVLGELARSYEKLGAPIDAARCRHLVRGTGAATPSRRGRRGYGNELSPRERDVARLLAGGRTNREIAQALFLSRRTVEEHVANILRKLNVASRNEVHL